MYLFTNYSIWINPNEGIKLIVIHSMVVFSIKQVYNFDIMKISNLIFLFMVKYDIERLVFNLQYDVVLKIF